MINFKLSIFLVAGIILGLSSNLGAQGIVRGKIFYQKDHLAAPFATISLLHHPGGKVSDKIGAFSLELSQGSKSDTLVISSVGYQKLFIPVQKALKKTEFELVQSSGDLDAVVVKSFSSEQIVGSRKETTGYFASWNTDSTGGEIGQIFDIRHKDYKINKIRFKVDNRGQACYVRLHIRRVVAGLPMEEIMRDSVSIPIQNMMMDDKNPEFDLTKYNIISKEKHIYIGLEILYCTPKGAQPGSFSFVGTEEGEYVYKSRRFSDWETSSVFSLYLKLFLGYDKND